jgi:vacuolar-type H+-ATPase subunit F/Vma7
VTVANKISVIIDVAVDKGVTSLKKFRSAIGEAETASGKMRAGFDVAKESIVANAANIAMAAGGALIAFGVKSVKAFQDTALAAGAFSDATGLAVDEASRLIEVAGDIGIEAGTVESALGKMNKTLGASPQLFADLGVEIAKTDTGATDVNGTFLNVVDRLNAIEDPAERARVASQLLGKGWQGMAELIGQGSTALKASLAGVADAQVIDPDELKKAREFRERMDDLNDRLQAVKMTVGESLVPALSDAAETIGTVTDALQAASSAAEDLTGTDLAGWAKKLTSPVDVATSAMDSFTDAIGSNVSATDGISYAWDYFTGNLEDGTTTIEHGTEAAAEMARIYGERVSPAVDRATTFVEDLEASTAALDDTYSAFLGKLNQQDAWTNFFEKMYMYHSETGRSEQETRDYVRAIAEMVMALEGVPPETKAQLIATLDAGNIAAVESRLNQIARNRIVSISGQVVGSGLRNELEGRAAGGPVTAGTPYLVGERGPEIVVPGRSGTVIPNNRIGVGGGGGGMVINITTGADPQAVIAAIKKFEKSNGAAWRS